MNRVFRILLVMSCLVFVLQANAQFDDPKTIEVGPHAGLSYYIGDINPAKHFAQSDLEFGGVARLNWDSRWSFRMDYTHATVKASDEVVKWRPERGLNFKSKIHDLSFVTEFNFLEYYTGNPKRNVSPYIFGGVSVFYYTAYALAGDSLIDLGDYKTEALPANPKWYEKAFGKTSPVGVSIPFGVGVKFSLSQHMAATAEWRMQKTFTDYLDDVATVYPAQHEHAVAQVNGVRYDLTDPTGNYSEGQQRGNSSFKDWFCEARVSLTWKFNLPDRRGCNLSKF